MKFTGLSEKALLRVEEVAAFFSIGKSTVYSWIREGALKTAMIGKMLRVLRTSVVEMVEEGERIAAAASPKTSPGRPIRPGRRVISHGISAEPLPRAGVVTYAEDGRPILPRK